jgi:uncharacterized protein
MFHGGSLRDITCHLMAAFVLELAQGRFCHGRPISLLEKAMPEPALNIDALRRALQERGAHEPVELIETHISWVLLAGEHAYKLKKPVRLAFLDFGTLAARRHFCEEELRLNRRLAASLYLDVLPVTDTANAPRLGGEGDAIDYALRMRRFPAGALFSERLAAGTLGAEQVDALARRIADFHASAPRAEAGSSCGTQAMIVDAALAVLSGIERFDGAAAVADLCKWVAAQAPMLRTPWKRRRAQGHVRECHGDLHLANAVLLDGQATAFDAVEFDPALRWIDTMSDAAFMTMDLMAHERPDLAYRFLNAYLEHGGDYEGLPVLRFYLVYRALVRALVARLRGGTPTLDPLAPDYLALARRLCTPGDARLLITHGLSGSGKTHVTQRLLERAGAIRARSDVERKRLHGLRPCERSASRVEGGIYGAEATRRTFEQLRVIARTALQWGHRVIIDAAFLRRHERTQFESLAEELGIPFTILHCDAPPQVLRQRVSHRAALDNDASEADLAVLEQQLGWLEGLSAREQHCALWLRTEQDIDIDALAAQWLHAGRR